MIKLRKFFDLLHKSAPVVLCDLRGSQTFYEGTVRGIPEEYSECAVIDFVVRESGGVLFLIEVKDGRAAPRRTNDSPIARMRRARGMTQAQLAEKAGCYTKDISRWESGKHRPGSKSLQALANALGCSIDEIMEE